MELDKIIISSIYVECNSLVLNVVELNQVIGKFEKGWLGLESILCKQRYTNDTSGLWYSKFNRTSSIKTIFVKSINAYNNVHSKKVQDNFQPKMTYEKNTFYFSKIK